MVRMTSAKKIDFFSNNVDSEGLSPYKSTPSTALPKRKTREKTIIYPANG
jgi:hypothetical protein